MVDRHLNEFQTRDGKRSAPKPTRERPAPKPKNEIIGYEVDEVFYNELDTWVAIDPAGEGAMVVGTGTGPETRILSAFSIAPIFTEIDHLPELAAAGHSLREGIR